MPKDSSPGGTAQANAWTMLEDLMARDAGPVVMPAEQAKGKSIRKSLLQPQELAWRLLPKEDCALLMLMRTRTIGCVSMCYFCSSSCDVWIVESAPGRGSTSASHFCGLVVSSCGLCATWCDNVCAPLGKFV